ncbi:hypothetical protein AT1219_140017 [Vibrio alginolyticus]
MNSLVPHHFAISDKKPAVLEGSIYTLLAGGFTRFYNALFCRLFLL